MSLVANTYASDLIDPSMRADESALLGRLGTRVPVQQIRGHQGSERLAEVCELICNDLATAQSEDRRANP